MIGERITKLRKGRKWTQEEMSKKVNIPRSTYSNYENGRREPDFETIKIFAELFEVSTDYLLGRTDKKEPEEKKEINHEAVTDLIEFLTNPNSTINGNPIPQDFITDIVGYVRTRTATDKPKDNH